MTVQDETMQEVGITNQDVALVLGYSNGITIERLSSPDSRKSILGSAPHVVQITIGAEVLDPCDLTGVVAITEETQGADVVAVTFEQECAKAKVRGRISILDRKGGPLEFTIQLGADWVEDVQTEMTIACPFLGAAAERPHYSRPGEGVGDSGPKRILQHSFLEFPPAVLSDEDTGMAVGFGLESDFPLNQQHFNQRVWQATGAADPGTHEIHVRPTHQLRDIMVMSLHAGRDGRNGVFESWKNEVRSNYDLRRYELPGPKWCIRTYLHHFTYAYGKEVFTYDRNEIDIKRLLDDGAEFGGYDAILYWHQYPRLGLDKRTQWDLYHDLPNGRETLREIVATCHDRGARFFLPFKPWDVRPSESLDDLASEIEELVEQTGVDGFFLDTMSTIPESFSRLVRDRFPDLMFCSEGKPTQLREIEQLTGSWDQVGQPTTVDVNLFRFVFPEHPKNTISRWSVGADKDRLIRRAVFNGCGLVIWQDVFGEWLPYSAEQKRRIREWKTVLSDHHDTIFGQRSVPLVDTLVPGLMANRFAADPDAQQVFALYNSTSKSISGPLLDVPEIENASCTQLWGEDGEMCVATAGSNAGSNRATGATIHGSVAAGDVVVIHVGLSVR